MKGDRMPFWQGRRLDSLIAILRIALGLVFVVGGLKLVLPALFSIPDGVTLAKKFTDPATGYISPLFASKITETLGLQISTFLRIEGGLEIILGLLLMAGLFTPFVAMNMGLMFWVFTLANPVVGGIRLSRDLGLMGLCSALILTGAGACSLERYWWGRRSRSPERWDLSLALIRLSVAYPMIVSALFTGGVFNNPLNTTLPMVLVFLIGLLLATGVVPRWAMLVVLLWMLYILPVAVLTNGFILGLDALKREFGFLAASLLYVVAGPDPWAWPRPSRLLCRKVVELAFAYLDGGLGPQERRAFESHIADCINCWRFLKTYRETVALGQQLREETIPPDVYERLETFVRARLRRSP